MRHVLVVVCEYPNRVLDADHFSLPRGQSTHATCREAIMFHFQGWKNEFTSFTTSQPPADAQVTLITQTGFIYLRIDAQAVLPNLLSAGVQLKTYADTLHHRIWSGRVIPSDLLEKGRAITGPAGHYIPRLLGRKLLAIISDPSLSHLADKKREIVAHNQQEMSTDYCIIFKEKISGCTCSLVGSAITVLRSGPHLTEKDTLTLITVGWADEIASGAADQLLSSFGRENVNKVI